MWIDSKGRVTRLYVATTLWLSSQSKRRRIQLQGGNNTLEGAQNN